MNICMGEIKRLETRTLHRAWSSICSTIERTHDLKLSIYLRRCAGKTSSCSKYSLISTQGQLTHLGPFFTKYSFTCILSQSRQTLAAYWVQHLKLNSTITSRQISNNMFFRWAEPERWVRIWPCDPSHIIFSILASLNRNPGNQWMTMWGPPSNSRQCIRDCVDQKLWWWRMPNNLSNGLLVN